MNNLNEFELFCLYHLGLAGTQAGIPLNLNQIAQRLNVSLDVLNDFLQEAKLDPQSVLNSGFDLVGAQMDIQLAPEGIHLDSVARRHFEEFRMLQQAN
jgi:hypothetical protein